MGTARSSCPRIENCVSNGLHYLQQLPGSSSCQKRTLIESLSFKNFHNLAKYNNSITQRSSVGVNKYVCFMYLYYFIANSYI